MSAHENLMQLFRVVPITLVIHIDVSSNDYLLDFSKQGCRQECMPDLRGPVKILVVWREAYTSLVHTVLYFQILFTVAVSYSQVLFAFLLYQHLRFHFLNYCLHKLQLHIFCNQFSRFRRRVHTYQVDQLVLSESNYGSMNLFKLAVESVNF